MHYDTTLRNTLQTADIFFLTMVPKQALVWIALSAAVLKSDPHMETNVTYSPQTQFTTQIQKDVSKLV